MVLFPGELSPIERHVDVALRFVKGESLTTRQIAKEYSISRQSAYRIVQRLAVMMPLVDQEVEGSPLVMWRLLDGERF